MNNLPDQVKAQKISNVSKSNVITATNNKKMENNQVALYLDEATMGVTLVDKSSGVEYKTTQVYKDANATWQGFCGSGITVEFYSAKTTIAEKVDIIQAKPQITVEYLDEGFNAQLYYEKYDFSMELQVRITEDGMTAFVPESSIKEGETYYLGAIYLFPMFGSTTLGEEEGYMFIPEGAGALIDLKDNLNKYKTPYTKRIYGANIGIDSFSSNSWGMPAVTEPESITAPVFGMVYTEKESGFLGIVDNGEYNSEILAYPNGVTTQYNWITAKFNYREIYTKQTAKASGVPTYEKQANMRDIGIRYILVKGQSANYTGLAKAYQNYLLANGDLKKQEDNFEIKLDFFGADSKKWFIFNHVVPMTTVEDMKNIITDLQEEDITDILPVYMGWQKKGISLNYGSGDMKLEKKLGSQNSLYKLIKNLDEDGIEFTVQQDMLLANTSRYYNTRKDIAKGINQTLVEKPSGGYVFDTMYYMTPSKSLDIVNKFIKKYSNTVISNISLTGITEALFSYYSNGTTYTRDDTAKKYEEILGQFGDFNVSLQKPNHYLWKYTDKYFDMAMSTSNYNFISAEVPFIPIVLKGYIPYWATYTNFEADEDKFFLKLLEYGAYPSFLLTEESPIELRDTNSSYIYTSEYKVLKEKLIQYYDEIGSVLEQVESVSILSHTQLAEDIVCVEYENGVKIVINYSDQDYSYNNTIVPGMSYHLEH